MVEEVALTTCGRMQHMQPPACSLLQQTKGPGKACGTRKGVRVGDTPRQYRSNQGSRCLGVRE